MREFLKSTKFKVMVCIVAVLLGIMIYGGATMSKAGSPSGLLGYIFTPIQKVSSFISRTTSEFFDGFLNARQYKDKNELLEEMINDYRKQLVDYESIKDENERLRSIVGIKESHTDFALEQAVILGRDASDIFGSFIIDKGEIHGVALNDPVITDAGLVGIISEINPTFARVSTVLSPSRNIGAYDITTNDLGVVSGEASLAVDGLCKMSYLNLQSQIKEGEIVVTTGVNGIFPKDLVIGTVKKVQTESHGTTLYATIKPAVDLEKIGHVFVITNFFGQGYEIESTQE